MMGNREASAGTGSGLDLRSEAWNRLEPILELFERALSRGERPALDAFLPALEASERGALLAELAYADLEFRLKAAEPARVEDYLTRYPELRSNPDVLLGLIRTEYRVRRQREPALFPAEYQGRFPAYGAALATLLAETPRREASASVGRPARGAARPGAVEAVVGPLPALARLGDFRILREIGRGGMGVVYEAEQVSLGRHVALKVLPQKLLLDAQTKQRFEREARSAARLHHTNIVPVFAVGEQDGMPYYVMQFIQGLGLDEVLEELKQLRPARHAPSVPSARRHIRNVSHNDVSAAEIARSLLTGKSVPGSGNASPSPQPLSPEYRGEANRAAPRAATFGGEGNRAAPLAPSEGARARGDGAVADAAPASTAPMSAPVVGSAPGPFASSPSSEALPGTTPGSAPKSLTYWQSTARIGFQVADALEYAHKQGVQHRDIKPSNLLLDTQGTVWITDFGLAKADDQQNLTHTGDLLGTLRYMPPEAFEGRTDARGDVYALGLTLYELLTLRPAFDERDRNRLIKQLTTAEPPRLDRLNRAVPRDLVTIVHKAIERDPARRYPTASALAADLQRFLADESIHARRQTQLERYLRWARHHPGIAVLGGVLTAVLVLATVASLLAAGYFNRAAQSEREARHEAEVAADEARRRGDAERWERYRANIAAAAGALQLQNSAGARSALDAAPPEHRNWEWQYFHSQLEGARLVVAVPGGKIRALALSPSGGQIAVCCGDHNLVYLYGPATGRLEAVLRGHSAPATSVAYRPDGKQIATAGNDQTIRLWDPATGQQAGLLKAKIAPPRLDHNLVVAYSSDGSRIASYPGLESRGGTSRLWDATTGREIAVLSDWQDLTVPVAFSPDGKRVAAGSGEYVYLRDAITGRQLAALGPRPKRVDLLAYSPDGKRIAFRTDKDSAIHLWDGASGKEIAALRGHASYVSFLLFSPDGSRLVSGGAYPDSTARLWDAAAGRLLAVLAGHKNSVESVAFSPDGLRMATASMDQTVRLWDGRTGTLVAVLGGHADVPGHVRFSPEGTRVVTAARDATLRLWEAETGESIGVLRGHGDGFHENCPPVFTPDGSLLVSGSEDGTVRFWDMNLVERNGVLRGHKSFVYDVAFSPDGEHVASGAWDGTARLWDATSGRQTGELPREKEIVSSVSYSRDGRRLVTMELREGLTVWDVTSQKAIRDWGGVPLADHDARACLNPAGTLLAAGTPLGPVRLLDVATGREVARLEGHDGNSIDATFHPDGSLLATSGSDGTVRLWDVATRAPVAVLRGHTRDVFQVAFNPDGKLLASASEDKTVRLWDARAHELIESIPLGSFVYGVAFSPDGTRLAAGCRDNTIRLIDVARRQQVAELRGHSQYVHAVAWSPDGTRLVSGSGDYTVRVWDSLSAQERARRGADKPASR
jgi:WD40 repeat protein/serine/threonine protein kinase